MKSIISVKNLTKKFNGLTAVDNVSFEIGKGEIFAFLGPNGAGKTTTIKILTTLLLPDAGKIVLNGADPVTSPDAVRNSFGIVFQDSSLDDELTAYENMEFHGVLYKVPKEKRQKRIRTLLDLVDLWNERDKLVKTFSGGMKRRLEIARGLLHYPKIFFLDEPTLGLDPQTRNHIWEYIKDLNKNHQTTIFFTTHYMDEAERNAKCIAIIDHGRIVAQGTPNQIKRKAKKQNLEDAFIALTGHAIRQEQANNTDNMKARIRVWRGRRR